MIAVSRNPGGKTFKSGVLRVQETKELREKEEPDVPSIDIPSHVMCSVVSRNFVFCSFYPVSESTAQSYNRHSYRLRLHTSPAGMSRNIRRQRRHVSSSAC